MTNRFLLFLLSAGLLAGCGRIEDDVRPIAPEAGPITPTPDAGVVAAGEDAGPFVPPVPTTLAQLSGAAFCGNLFGCRMFVQSGRIFVQTTAPFDDGGVGATAIVSVPVDGGAVTTIAGDGTAERFIGPFAAPNGIEWFATRYDAQNQAGPTELFAGSGAGTDATQLGTYNDGGASATAFWTASDDSSSIYVVTAAPNLVKIAKSDGTIAYASTSPLEDVGGQPQSDDDPNGFVYMAQSRYNKSDGAIASIPWVCPSDACQIEAVGGGLLFGLAEQGDGDGAAPTASLFATPVDGGANVVLGTSPVPTGESASGDSLSLRVNSAVADGRYLYWIATDLDWNPVYNTYTSSVLWRAPFAGGPPQALLTDTIPDNEYQVPQGLTGVALDDSSIYVATGDGRMLRLPK